MKGVIITLLVVGIVLATGFVIYDKFYNEVENCKDCTVLSTMSLSSEGQTIKYATPQEKGIQQYFDNYIKSKDGDIELVDNFDGTLSLYVNEVRVANYSGLFWNNGVPITDFSWSAQYNGNSTNITYIGQSAIGNLTAWFIPKENGFKYGAKFSGVSALTMKVRFNWTLAEGISTLQDKDIPERIYISGSGLNDYFIFDYNDMPDGASIDLFGAEIEFVNTQNWEVDPNFGGTEDGADRGRTLAVSMGGQTHTINVLFFERNNITTIANYGSYNDIHDPSTIREPMSIQVNSTVALEIGTNTATIQIHETESCLSRAVYTQTFTNNNDLLGQPNIFNINLDSNNFTSVGEKCINMTVTANNGINSGTGTDAGKFLVAPYLDNPVINVSAQNYENYFKVINLTHNLVSLDAGNITQLWFRLVNSSNGADIGSWRLDSTPSDLFIEQLINFPTNPTPNHNLTYNYTNWTDNNTNHTRFSTSSLNSINGNAPKPIAFNLSDNITVIGFTSWDNIGVYNRGETTRKNITIGGWDGQPFTITGGVEFDIIYRLKDSSSNEFSGTSMDVNATGGLNTADLIPTTATALLNSIGQPYDIYLEVNANADANEKMFTTLGNVRMNGQLNVSNMYTVENRVEKDSTLTPTDPEINALEGYQTAYSWNNIKNVRGQNLNGISTNLIINNTSTSTFSTQSLTTGSDGWTTTSSNANSQKPTGLWSFNGTVNHNGNTGNDISYVDFQEGGADPLTLTCSDYVQVNTSNISCTLKLTYLNGTGIPSQSPQINFTYPNGTSILKTMNEVAVGNYRGVINATLQGSYLVIANNTFGGYNYFATYNVLAQPVSSGSGSGSGGLTTEQNGTLYNLSYGRNPIQDVICDISSLNITINCIVSYDISTGTIPSFAEASLEYRIYRVSEIGNFVQIATDTAVKPSTSLGPINSVFYFNFTPSVSGVSYIIRTSITDTFFNKDTLVFVPSTFLTTAQNTTINNTYSNVTNIYAYMIGTLTTKIDAIKTVVDTISSYLSGFITTKLNDIMNIQLNGSTNVSINVSALNVTSTINTTEIWNTLVCTDPTGIQLKARDCLDQTYDWRWSGVSV